MNWIARWENRKGTLRGLGTAVTFFTGITDLHTQRRGEPAVTGITKYLLGEKIKTYGGDACLLNACLLRAWPCSRSWAPAANRRQNDLPSMELDFWAQGK